MKKFFVLLLVLCCFIYGQRDVCAYEHMFTHPGLTEVAVQQSGLDDFLKQYLNISEGKMKIFNAKVCQAGREVEYSMNILRWLRFGSKYEDLATRKYNHFHEPLKNSGLDNDLFIIPYTGLSDGIF